MRACVRPSHCDNRDPWLDAWTDWVHFWQVPTPGFGTYPWQRKHACQIWARLPSQWGSYGALSALLGPILRVRPWHGWSLARRVNRLSSFLAGTYSWTTATPTTKGDPSSSHRGVMGHKHSPWQRKHACQIWARSPSQWELRGPNVPLGPNFAKVCWLRPNGLADLVDFWQVYLPLNTGNPDPKDGPLLPQRGSYFLKTVGLHSTC